MCRSVSLPVIPFYESVNVWKQTLWFTQQGTLDSLLEFCLCTRHSVSYLYSGAWGRKRVGSFRPAVLHNKKLEQELQLSRVFAWRGGPGFDHHLIKLGVVMHTQLSRSRNRGCRNESVVKSTCRGAKFSSHTHVGRLVIITRGSKDPRIWPLWAFVEMCTYPHRNIHTYT